MILRTTEPVEKGMFIVAKDNAYYLLISDIKGAFAYWYMVVPDRRSSRRLTKSFCDGLWDDGDMIALESEIPEPIMRKFRSIIMAEILNK